MITEADMKVLNAEADPFEAAFAAFTAPAEKDAQMAADVEKPVTEAEKDAQIVAAVEKPLPKAPAVIADTQTAEGMEAELVAEAVAKGATTEKPVDSAAQTEATLRRFTEAIEKVARPVPATTPVRAVPTEPEIYTPEEKAFLDTYDKDWAAVATGEALKRRAEYRQVVQYVFDQMLTQIKPMMTTLRTLSERAHSSDLSEIAEDYDAIRDKVVEWAADQPTYLQVAYQHVIQHGTPAEVENMIGRWRTETGAQKSDVSAQTQVPGLVSKPAIELTAGTKKAVARLAPVIGKRTGVQQGLDPNDFDAAFETFANRLKEPGA